MVKNTHIAESHLHEWLFLEALRSLEAWAKQGGLQRRSEHPVSRRWCHSRERRRISLHWCHYAVYLFSANRCKTLARVS